MRAGGLTFAASPVGQRGDAKHAPEIPDEVRHVSVAHPPGHGGHRIGAGTEQLAGALQAKLRAMTARLHGVDEAAVDFGTNGAWLWNAGVWTQLTAGNPENMVAFNADGDGARELAVDLGTQGLWVWNGGVWGQLGASDPEYLVAADTNHNGLDELIVDFGPAGLSWRQDSGTFSVISGVDAQNLIVLDVDGNGTQELAADFGATDDDLSLLAYLGTVVAQAGVPLLAAARPDLVGCRRLDAGSWFSSAFAGEVGDRVEVQTPGGALWLEIIEIE